MTARLVIVGAAGAGKSAIAEILARRWSVPLLDTDDIYTAQSGQTVGEAIVDDEQGFRDEEQRIALAALDTRDAVVALGSGAVESAEVREALHPVSVVWLQVGLADSARRTGLSGPRPVALGNVRGQLQQMLDQRADVYRTVADLTVATDGRSAADVAEEIHRWEANRGQHD